MKKLLSILALSFSVTVYAQSVTDSVNTSIGDFIVVSSEEIEESSAVTEESTSTSDGGSVELVTPGFSGARLSSSVVTSQLNVRLAPNPSSGVVELQVIGVEGVTSIVVTNLLGQVVYSTNISVTNTRTTYLPAQLWTSGTYIVVTSAGGQTVSTRLIVE